MSFFQSIGSLLLVSGTLFSANASMQMHLFQSVPMQKATLLQDGDVKIYCPVCGMNLPMFYKTNHAAKDHDHINQYCSIHCLVEDKELNHADLQNIQVVDVVSLEFIDATTAHYVVGSHKKGTMSMVSKYAFKDQADATAFARKNGGTVMDFQDAYNKAKEDFANDARMIAKKQQKMAKKGMMIYTKMCKKTDKKFSSIAEAKAFVSDTKLCDTLNPKQLQAVGLYLFKR